MKRLNYVVLLLEFHVKTRLKNHHKILIVTSIFFKLQILNLFIYGIHTVQKTTDICSFDVSQFGAVAPNWQPTTNFSEMMLELHVVSNWYPTTNFSGILFTDGNPWATNRRFALRHLKDLGMGKTRLEASIQDEAAMLVKYLETHNTDGPSEIGLGFSVSVVNVIWQLMASKLMKSFS